VIGVTMPGGDPGLLEQLAARLEAIAEGTANLGASTRQVTDSIRSGAGWTGDAADPYTAFTGNLAQGVAATPAPLSKIALAVQEYAGCLRTAQEKVATYTSAAEVAEVSGNDSGYVSAAELAAQIEFFEDGRIELERFASEGVVEAPGALTELLAWFDE
jgi:uncharacterized protein YukE